MRSGRCCCLWPFPHLRGHHPGLASGTSPCFCHTHDLPGILALPSCYSFTPWGPFSQLQPPSVTSPPRALLEGLALNTHMDDLHLDLSACEVSPADSGLTHWTGGL